MKTTKISNVEEIVYTKKLDNGLMLFMIPNSKVNNYYVTLNVKYGSVHNKFKYNEKDISLPKGIAHFLEHLMFNMPDDENVFEYYSKLGSRINAFTTFDFTCYEVFSNTKLKENLSYLLKYVYTPHFSEKVVEQEKGIITEEIKMIKDNPYSQLFYSVYNNVYINEERRNSISGEIKDIIKITNKDISLAYDAFYHPENMFLVVTGNFDPNEVIAITEQTLNGLKFKKYIKPLFENINEPNEVKTKLFEKQMSLERPKLAFSIKIPKDNFKDLNLSELELKMYLNLITQINFGITSLLTEDLITNNITTESLNDFLTVTKNHYVLSFFGSTSSPELLTSKIKDKLKHLEITQEDLQRKKKTSISNLILSFDQIQLTNSQVQEDIINYDKYINNRYNYYKDMDINKAIKVLKNIDNYKEQTTLIKPKK